MHFQIHCISWLVLSSAALLAQSPRRTAMVELAEKAQPCVVAIYSKSGAAGSGSVISPHGIILTNDHVVRNTEGRVLFHDGSIKPYRVIGRCPEKDLALILVPVPKPVPSLPLGRSHDVMTGEPALVAGNPGGRGIVFSSGIISSPRVMVDAPNALVMQQFPDDVRDRFIQFDAASNPGNSGGPLINAEGSQVGIVVAMNKTEQNVNFAIPIDRLRTQLATMIAPEVKGAFLIGIECDPLAESAIVTKVTAGSPAALAGVRTGDVLLSFTDITLRHGLDWTLAISGGSAGKSAPLKWQRDGKELSATLTAVAFPLPAASTAKDLQPVLRYAVYPLERPKKLPNFATLKPAREGVTTSLDPRSIEPKLPSFALVLEGMIDVQTTDWFRLIIESDDGSRVQFHGETVLDNDGAHPPQEAGVVLRAAKGLHPLRIEFFEATGGSELKLWMESPNGDRIEVTGSKFMRTKAL